MGNNCACGCDDVGVPAGKTLIRGPPKEDIESEALEDRERRRSKEKEKRKTPKRQSLSPLLHLEDDAIS